MSIIRKKYQDGETELNKLTFQPYMGAGHPGKPPLVTKTVPNETSSNPNSLSEVQRRVDDLTRITKLFTRREGLQFLRNNTTLNTAVDQSYTINGTIKDKISALADIRLGVAVRDTLGTLASTLAQVPLAGTGTHFTKGVLFGQKPAFFNTLSKTTENIGQPGKVVVKYGRDATLGKSPNDIGTDKVNELPYYSGTEAKKESKDYIKFFFEILTPGETNNTFVHFRAFLDSFDDSYNGLWNELNYIGRGEQFYTYQNFTRSINVSFKSAVATKVELKPVYQKLALLASTTAPTYSTKEGLMRGTIVKLNIGDYLSDTPGFFTNVTYGWESRYPFEIAAGKTKEDNDPATLVGGGLPRQLIEDSNTDNTIQELPHVLNCSFTFTPIHKFTPQTGAYPYITNPVGEKSIFLASDGSKVEE